jgi:hypothetical protein
MRWLVDLNTRAKSLGQSAEIIGQPVLGIAEYFDNRDAIFLARRSVIGTSPGKRHPQTNGLAFWKFRDPDTGTLSDFDQLRKEHLNRPLISDDPPSRPRVKSTAIQSANS